MSSPLTTPRVVAARGYVPPIPPDDQHNDMPVRRVDEDAIPLADLVVNFGIQERAYSMVGFLADGARVRATDAAEAAVLIRRSLGAGPSDAVAILGSTPHVFYGVPVHAAKAGLDLLRGAETAPDISFDKVSRDLRAFSPSDDVVLTFPK